MDDYGINVAKFLYDEALARAEAAEATVRELALSVRALFARAEAAEAEVYKLGSRLAEWIDRAHTAEAEVKRLREQVAEAQAPIA